MRILDKYIGMTVAQAMLLVLAALLSLFALTTFIDELTRFAGKGRYDAWHAAYYVALMIPGLTYQLFPPAALLGCMVGLGGLASTSELIAMRAAGMPARRITQSVLLAGMGMVVLTLVIGEVIAPWAVRKAELMKTLAISGQANMDAQKGLWLRQGGRVIHIGLIESTGRLANVEIVDLNVNGQVDAINKAASAIHQGDNHWLLHGYERVQFAPKGQGATISLRDSQPWDGLLTEGLLDVVTVRANAMPVWTLYQYIEYLEANGLASQKYVGALWSKLVTPLTIAVMVLLAVPIIFGPLRSVGASTRIVTGMMIGVGFYLMNQVAGYVGLVFQLDPRVAAIFPTVMFALIAWRLLQRVQ